MSKMLSKGGRGGPSPVLPALQALGEVVLHGAESEIMRCTRGVVLVIGAPKSERVSCVLVHTMIVGQIRCFGDVFTGYTNKIMESSV